MLKLNKIFVSALLFSLPAFSAPVYFLIDQNQTPQYVIKPVEPKCPKMRDYISCRRTAQAEALAYALADTIGLSHLTPETHLAVIPFGSVEKLCSIQEYLHKIENLRDLAEEWLKAGLEDNELLGLIDPSNFEELFLFILLCYDTDAHANNIYARKNEAGIYHLIKLDNGLTFPDKNKQLFNALYLLPQARNKFSERMIEKIETLPMERLEENFAQFEMQDAFPAFKKRVEILKQFKDHSMREIDIHFRKLENANYSF
ncbi:MAG: hypothetical protein JSS30_01085 [Verrucomicrobia bacterium]|nr:hypothetical protein [Verrucomicrobiota bacterium]